MAEKTIMAEDAVIVCRCEEVTREEVARAIREGAATVAGVKKRTHAGMGLCQGRTCRKLVAAMLAEGSDPAAILPDTVRPPVRAVRIDEIAREDEE